ncbi:MAG: hypothetical protein A2V21_310130 [Deltaproteobacteria bacterium GWC2_55_46]|nr:MAG: hypothetical protein A2V21_310130 [Deltaproteobacteria bacterium GWC2_55_46]
MIHFVEIFSYLGYRKGIQIILQAAELWSLRSCGVGIPVSITILETFVAKNVSRMIIIDFQHPLKHIKGSFDG